MLVPERAQKSLLVLLVVCLLAVFPVWQARAFSDTLSDEAEELAARPPVDLQLTLMPFLTAWAALEDGQTTWTTLYFSEDGVGHQARTVIAIIEANHAEYPDEETPAAVLAVLQAAATIADPYDVFFEPDTPAHPLFAGYTPMALQRLLADEGSVEAGEALRSAMRAVWKDYRGRSDLSGMIGEESPNAIERWLFEEPAMKMAEMALPDLTKVCQPAFDPVWACQRADGKVDTLCVGEGKERLVQFRTTMPGQAPDWTHPEQPKPATEVMDFWINGTTLISEVKEGPQSLIMMRADGPMGTDGRVSTEFNMNPGRPNDCKILVDSIAERFKDLISRAEGGE